jgi:hypothetical protein
VLLHGIPLNESVTLVQQVFDALSNTDIFDTAIECLVNVFQQPEAYRWVSVTDIVLEAIFLRPERATTSFQMRRSQGMTFAIALSMSTSSPTCVSAPCIGLVSPVPHSIRSYSSRLGKVCFRFWNLVTLSSILIPVQIMPCDKFSGLPY